MRVLLMFTLLLPVLSFAQIMPSISPQRVNTGNDLPPGVNSFLVKYSRLMKIARKYGVDKNFTYEPRPTNPSGKPPEKVYLKMSLAQFEAWMKRLSFEEKKVKILNQFFLKDFQEVCTVKEYIALRRAYVKKYPAYLKDVASFQEARILQDEAHPELVNINTPCFRKEEKQP